MHESHFNQALKNISQRDGRFDVGAFHFLKEALDFTSTRAKHEDLSHHVTASELLLGFRDHIIHEYGPMAATLLDEWGIKCCRDIGDMVFLLIEEGMFGKQDSDKHEDFIELYNFQEAFVLPYQPKRAAQQAQ